jgi:hypothetical protein
MEELIKLNEECLRVGKNLCKSLRHNKPLTEKIIQATSFLSEKSLMSERVYCLLNDIIKTPSCKMCPKEVNFDPQKSNYNIYCSSRCVSEDPDTQTKRKLKRDESEINKKREKTNLIRHGAKNVMHTEEGRQKVKEDKLALYSDPVRRERAINEYEKTLIETTGYRNAGQVPEYQEKAKKTSLRNWGFESYLQTKESRELSEIASKTPEAKAKIVATLKKKHGPDIDNAFKLKKSVDNRNRSRFLKKIHTLKLLGIIALFEYEEFKGVDREHEYPFKCEKCSTIFKDHLDWGHIPRCFICNPRILSTSKYELEIRDCILQMGYKKTIIMNDHKAIKPHRRRSKELDLYFPEDNFAIEFNGLWSHSEYLGQKDLRYHLSKTILCSERGIQLIHVFQDDWVNNQEIIKSIIRSRLKLISSKIPANKCNVRVIEKDQITPFLKDNHLDYPLLGSHHFGLYFKDELVYVISLGTPQRNKKYQLQLYRSCGKINTIVMGGFSKIIKQAIKTLNIKSLISYVDRSLFVGDAYKDDWRMIKTIRPDYQYVDLLEEKRYHKSNFKREGIQAKFPEFYQKHQSKTEKVMMFIMTVSEKSKRKRFDRIWTCGLLVFEYKIKQTPTTSNNPTRKGITNGKM